MGDRKPGGWEDEWMGEWGRQEWKYKDKKLSG
jgi:hypothetical protein